MIYSDDFVWLHFPKCAGVKIENLFKTYYSAEKSISQDLVDPVKDPRATWHDSVSDRENRDPNFKLENRVIICSFRKLPGWLESRYSFEVQRSPQLSHNPELLLEGKFLEQGGIRNHADYYIKKYLPESILRTGRVRFIRTEHFESDFKNVFGEFVNVTIIPNAEFSKKLNVSKSAVPDDIRDRLLHSREVYEQCPDWKAVENIAYG